MDKHKKYTASVAATQTAPDRPGRKLIQSGKHGIMSVHGNSRRRALLPVQRSAERITQALRCQGFGALS